MTTTAAIHPITAYDQVVHLRISRTAYDALLESLGDDAHVRLTYDGEILEIMSPREVHEIVSRIVAEMLVLISLEWRIDITDLGTMRFQPVGGHPFEPDGAWWVAMGTRVRDKKTIDLAVDPPPDILLETDITNDSSNKFAIFAGMRVPEVWCYNLVGFSAKALVKGEYIPIDTSRAVAGLPIAEIKKRIEDQAQRDKSDMYLFRREWQQWLQEHRHLHDDELN